MRITGAVLVVLMVVTGCSDDAKEASDSTTSTIPSVDGRTFEVTRISVDGSDRPVANRYDGTPPTLRFSGGVLWVNGTCNGGNGPYTIERARLFVTDFASSLMGCEDGGTETAITLLISRQPAIELTGRVLTLRTRTLALDAREEA